MMNGWIKLHRKVIDSEVFQDEALFKVFCWCLLKANHKETWVPVRTGRGNTTVRVGPGSFMFGREKAAKELRMRPSSVWDRMRKLRNIGILDIQPNTHFSLITIINWTTYQGINQKSNRQTDNHPTTNRHIQERREEKNISPGAFEILSYLNEKTGRNYRKASHIEARLKDGATIADCKRVIETKTRDPYFIQNPKYLNPETLFRPSNFDRYVNEAPEVEQSW